MRLLIDVADFGPGGMERQVMDLASGLAARNHHIEVVANKGFNAFKPECMRGRFASLELRRQSRYDPRVLMNLVSVMRRFRPEVVLCVNFNATLWGRLAGLLAGDCQLVVAEHSSTRPFMLKVAATNFVLGRRTAAVIACASSQVGCLVKEHHPSQRIRVIPNGVDLKLYCPSPDLGAAYRARLQLDHDVPLVGIVAAHRREKRFDRFIRLVEDLHERGLGAVGLMVGGGPLLEETRERARRSRVSRHLVVPGPETDMRAVYSACDVVVLVSDSETFPLVLLEAQACGTPVVAYDTGGVGETFQHGVTGILVAQGDSRSLATAVGSVLADQRRRAQMGKTAPVFVEGHYSIQRMVDRYEMLLTSLLDHRAQGSTGRPRDWEAK